MNSPCKGCEHRKFLCHGSCEAYKAFCRKNEEIRLARIKENGFRYPGTKPKRARRGDR